MPKKDNAPAAIPSCHPNARHQAKGLCNRAIRPRDILPTRLGTMRSPWRGPGETQIVF